MRDKRAILCRDTHNKRAKRSQTVKGDPHYKHKKRIIRNLQIDHIHKTQKK